jgi:hypothetical protein
MMTKCYFFGDIIQSIARSPMTVDICDCHVSTSQCVAHTAKGAVLGLLVGYLPSLIRRRFRHLRTSFAFALLFGGFRGVTCLLIKSLDAKKWPVVKRNTYSIAAFASTLSALQLDGKKKECE